MSGTNRASTGRPKGKARNPAKQALTRESLRLEMKSILQSLVQSPVPSADNSRKIAQLIAMYREIATAYREGHADPPSPQAPLPPNRSSSTPARPSHPLEAEGSTSTRTNARSNPSTATTTATAAAAAATANAQTEQSAAEWKTMRGRVIVSFEAWAKLLEEALECARKGDRVGYRHIFAERLSTVKLEI